MERRLSLTRRALARLFGRVAALLVLWRTGPARAEERLVLVVGRDSRIERVNLLELHKLYLGLAVEVDGVRLRALRNASDELMRQVFYQSIVSMSEPVYDRRMLALTLQQGASPPPTLTDTQQVFERLAGDPEAISFAWAVDAERDRRVRVLRVLWHR